jgi:hypothetical protein
MSSLSLIEATPQRVSLRLEQGLSLKTNLGIFFTIIFWASLAALLLSSFTGKVVSNDAPNIFDSVAALVGLIMIFFLLSIVINYFKLNDSNITVFIFDKNSNEIWFESHNSKGLKSRNLFGDLTKIRTATLQEKTESNGELVNCVISFSFYFLRDSGTSIIVYGDSISGAVTQSERERFNEQLENARTIMTTLNNFLNSNAI